MKPTICPWCRWPWWSAHLSEEENNDINNLKPFIFELVHDIFLNQQYLGIRSGYIYTDLNVEPAQPDLPVIFLLLQMAHSAVQLLDLFLQGGYTRITTIN